MTKPNKGNSKLIRRQVLYVPPDAALFETLAEETCNELTLRGYAEYSEQEVVTGLSEFLTVIANVTAKALTKGKANWLNLKHRNQLQVSD